MAEGSQSPFSIGYGEAEEEMKEPTHGDRSVDLCTYDQLEVGNEAFVQAPISRAEGRGRRDVEVPLTRYIVPTPAAELPRADN